ncbi:hypothetical protein SAGO17_00121 [Mimivirus AB-566-O17]|uniref:Uncharacterized protein n=1 Tax=Mimivirus AB-566-O17 TaxID=1988039 RepID=A0A1X9VNZ2_9VIRU|nr:hypothetical protein SAGO17_00121 [Mimivirus AB-566-O17]
MTALIIAYSNTLKGLYKFVKEVCPEELHSINQMESVTNALENTSYSIFFDWCNDILAPYKCQIMNCDSDFFLGMNSDSWNSSKKMYFSKFTQVYKTLSEENRVKLWWYFQQLIKISERVAA